MSTAWDVIIAGAGPAGAVAANVLALAGRRVLLIDDVEPGVQKVGESVPGSVRPLLRDLNLLALVERAEHLPSCGNVSAWGSSTLAATDFIRDPHGSGWHLNRTRFDADLREAALRAGVFWRQARVRAATPAPNAWHVRLTDGETKARWLIDATGRQAALARSLGAKRSRDDALVALCAWSETGPADFDTRTLVEAAPEGWWYTAQLPNETRVVVFHVDAGDAVKILHQPDGWKKHLARTVYVRRKLNGATFETGPRATEACGARLDHFFGKGWAAVGDAALSFDPLSSQGILNAIYTGMSAGHAVHAALGGRFAKIEAYASRLEEIRAAYLYRHSLVYRSERRWLDRPFWKRRQTMTMPNEYLSTQRMPLNPSIQ